MNIRYLLKNYRLDKRYTQKAMADTLHMSRQQYSNIENGKTAKISEANKKRLSEVLNIPNEMMESLDVIVYPKNEEMPILSTNIGNLDQSNSTEKLLEKVLEQNKLLTELLEKLSAKL